MQQGKVFLPTNPSWVTDLKTELLSFPAGKHDDQVDVLALIGLAINDMHNSNVKVKSIMMG